MNLCHALGVAAALTFAPAALASTTPKGKAEALIDALLTDRNLTSKAGDQLSIVVVFAEGDPASVEAKEEMLLALHDVVRWRVRHLKVAVVEMAYSNAGRMISAIRARDLDVVLLMPGLTPHVPGILAATKATQARSMSVDAAHLRLGVSFVVDSTGRVVIDAGQAEREGVALATGPSPLAAAP